MKALITGSAGFVGRHIVWALVQHGYEVHGIDIKPIAHNAPPYSSGYTHLQSDCRDYFRRAATRYDLVVHLAAIVGGRATIDGDPLRVATDLSIDAEMFNWALKTGQERVVYYSSSAAYPTHMQNELPASGTTLAYRLQESDVSFDIIGAPDQTYGWSKLTGEVLAHHALQQGMRVYVFRPFSGYGEDQDLDYPFPSFIQRATQGATPFTVWGDGTQTRDWIHIDDVIAGTFAFVDADNVGPVNLCTGRATSFTEFACMCTSASALLLNAYDPSHLPPLEYKLDAPRGVTYRVGDPTRMNTLYTARVTLEEGIRRAMEVTR